MNKIFECVKENQFKLLESINPITKIEEDEAFQYIKKVLIPELVKYWKTLGYSIAREDIGRSLIKKENKVIPSKMGDYSYIRYESEFQGGIFVFEIIKTPLKKIITTWRCPGMSERKSYLVGQEINNDISLESKN